MYPLDSTLEAINAFRKSLGLKPIIKKVCNCLSCQKQFQSFDYPRQRLCVVCRSNTDDSFSQDLLRVGY